MVSKLLTFITGRLTLELSNLRTVSLNQASDHAFISV